MDIVDTLQKTDYYLDLLSRLTFNSNAIEGNTLSLAATRIILFEPNTPVTSTMREIYEVINHRKAINYLLQIIDNKQMILTPEIIITINRYINENVLYIGGYRFNPVKIIGSEDDFPLPLQLEVLMNNFIEKYNEIFEDKVTYRDLAQFHIDFESIHPFQDGNGRTGRLLINFQLLKHGLAPIVISSSNRLKYLEIMGKRNTEELASMIENLHNKENERISDFVSMYEVSKVLKEKIK